MEDKSLFSSNRSAKISDGLQNFIDSMVEEIVLEGKPFDTQKKYLCGLGTCIYVSMVARTSCYYRGSRNSFVDPNDIGWCL